MIRRNASRELLIVLSAIIALATTLLVPIASASTGSQSDEIGADTIAPTLERAFERSGGDSQDFWIVFDGTADTSGARDIDDWAERGSFVVDRLRQTAREVQADVAAMLDANGVDHTSYWISNAIWVEAGDYPLALALAGRPEVERLIAPVTYDPPAPVSERPTARRTGPDAVASVEWGVRNVKADQVWQQYGVRGDGIVVGNIDTGVEVEHPALVNSYRGYDDATGTFDHDYNWFDATGTCDGAPCDNNGHGTHTMGTMVGDDGGANQIGVAPGVTWIAANGCATCADDDLLASAQWMLAPTRADGSAPDPALRPDIVNNSWGTTEPTNDPLFEDVLVAWADAGMFGVWSNGNLGARGCASSGSPGSRTLNYSVGAYDSSNTIAGFSSRGPGQDGEIKPNISAPGVAVRSAWPDGRYVAANGTSMAAPHTAGAIALLWSAEPALIGDLATTRQLLDDTAIDTSDDQCGGTDDDNNVYGEGRLDALALVSNTQGDQLGTVSGSIIDDESGEPIGGAVIELTDGVVQRSMRSGDDGSFGASIPAGDYEATVTAFGYEPATAGVVVTAGQTTVSDISLTAIPGFEVSGRVVDKRTGRPIPGARVNVMGSPYQGTTDLSGAFAIDGVPAPKTYTIHIDGGGCSQQSVYRTVELTADVQLPTVELARKTDQPSFGEGWGWGGPYGYSCLLEPTRWIAGDTEVARPELFHSTPVQMPFPFTYFGREYRKLYVDGTKGRISFWTLDRTENGQLITGLAPWTDNNPVFDAQSKVLTRTRGTAPNRTFTVEYRDMTALNDPAIRYSFEVTLHEDGDFVFAFRGIDPDQLHEQGLNSSVELEDHSPDDRLSHRVNFVYSDHEAVLDDARQIHFSLPANGFVRGTVVDHVTGRPVPGATVDVYDRFGKRVLRTATDDAGHYRVQLFVGQPYEVAVLAPPGYQAPPRAAVRVTRDRQVVGHTTRLHGGRFAPKPGQLTLEPGRNSVVTLANSGTRPLIWWASRHLADPGPAPGTELSAVRAAQLAIGVGVEEVDGSYWVAGIDGTATGRLVEVTSTGDPTGRTIDPATVADGLGISATGLVGGDMAWVESRGWLCVSFLQGERRKEHIACVDPDRSEVEMVIPTHFGADYNTINGLAYDARTDRFFVIGTPADGSGFQRRIRTLAGFEHAEPGRVLGTCTYARLIQGLAWNPTSRTLWSTSSSVLRQIDSATCAEISSLQAAYSAGAPSTGLDLESDGDVVAMLPFTSTVSTIRSGDRIGQRIPWLTVSPGTGSLSPGRSQKLTVRVDWSRVPDGVTKARVVLRGNGGPRSKVTIPITLRR